MFCSTIYFTNCFVFCVLSSNLAVVLSCTSSSWGYGALSFLLDFLLEFRFDIHGSQTGSQ